MYLVVVIRVFQLYVRNGMVRCGLCSFDGLEVDV